MDDGFDFLMFGGAEVERDAEEAEEFNERRNRLVEIHGNLLDNFLSPVVDCGELTSSESAELDTRLGEMNSWYAAINSNVKNATQDDLSQYATAIGEAAVRAIRLCKEHGVYEDIRSVEYVSNRKMIVVNGEDLYFIG